jgi:hypothetical protein
MMHHDSLKYDEACTMLVARRLRDPAVFPEYSYPCSS